MSVDEAGNDPVLEALASQVEGMVIGYVVVAEFIGPDGDSLIFSDTFENQRNHHSLGLLAFRTAVETKRASEAWESDE